MLSEAEDEGPPQTVLHAGELVQVTHTVRPRFAWHGPVNGKTESREGELVEVRRASGEGGSLAFRSDLDGEVRAPTRAWLCRRMEAGPECEGRLRRLALRDGGTLAYEACYVGPCRLALARGRAVSTITVDGLTELRLATVQDQPVALATVRWMKSPTWTGGSTIVLRVDGSAPARALEIVTDEVKVDRLLTSTRQGQLTVAADGLRFHGVRKETGADGLDLASQDLDEIYRLARPLPR